MIQIHKKIHIPSLNILLIIVIRRKYIHTYIHTYRVYRRKPTINSLLHIIQKSDLNKDCIFLENLLKVKVKLSLSTP
jgi:hypothetical protein